MAQESRLERQFRRQCRICEEIGAKRMLEILREEVLPSPGWTAFEEWCNHNLDPSDTILGDKDEH